MKCILHFGASNCCCKIIWKLNWFRKGKISTHPHLEKYIWSAGMPILTTHTPTHGRTLNNRRWKHFTRQRRIYIDFDLTISNIIAINEFAIHDSFAMCSISINHVWPLQSHVVWVIFSFQVYIAYTCFSLKNMHPNYRDMFWNVIIFKVFIELNIWIALAALSLAFKYANSSVPSHYLNQSWFHVNWTLMCNIQWNSERDELIHYMIVIARWQSWPPCIIASIILL